MDITHIPCGEDGWGHLAAIIDCHDRELIGFEFALRGRVKSRFVCNLTAAWISPAGQAAFA